MAEEPDNQCTAENSVEPLSMNKVWQELAEFEKYFSSGESSKELVNWLYDEYQIPKAASRLALKYIAPMVLKQAGKLSNKLKQSWLNKLNDRFIQNPWYEQLSRKLLDFLKTKSDKTGQNAISNADTQTLKNFQCQPGWGQLSTEQQGIAQLLLQGEQQHDAVKQRFDQLTELLESFAFDLELLTVEQLQDSTAEAELGSAPWLTYRKRQAALIGRDTELEQLDDFYLSDKTVSWWAITGAGGLGKSRLALESLARLEPYWSAGFLAQDKLNVADALSHWRPAFPTVIVIDYVAPHSEQIGHWLDALLRQQDNFDFPVRLLLLERDYKEQDWWKQLTTGQSQNQVRSNALYQTEPMVLTPLLKTEQQTALANFLAALNASQKRPEDNSALWDTIHTLTGGSPLFLGMVAIALLHSSTNDIRNWNQHDLLDNMYDREHNLWQKQLSAFSTDPNKQNQVIDLLAFATLVNGIDWENYDETVNALIDAELIDQKKEIETLWHWVERLSGSEEGSIQPDLIGEYFLLKHYPMTGFKPKDRRVQRILQQAFNLAPTGIKQTLIRCATDYPKNTTPQAWWQHLHSHFIEQQSELDDTAFAIVNRLMLHGRYQIALEHWLPTLEQSKDLKTKSWALNQIGLVYKAIGQYVEVLKHYQQSLTIEKEIGDRQGEGATLNNMATLAHAQGDYPKALDYLKQVLPICREIGDRQGEGATLNNMATIAHAQGDHPKALDYLEQSLTIRREIGDRRGEGATLNNMAALAHAQGDYHKALVYLEQSLTILREIGDRKGEGTTLNNIGQIYKAQGDYPKTLDYLEQSLAIRQEIGDRQGESVTLNNISQIYHAQGDYLKALQYSEQDLAIVREIGDRAGEGTTLNNISQIYDAQGDDDKALDYLEQSLTIRREIGDKAGLCVTLINLGNIYAQKEQIDNALSHWLEAYQIASDIGFKKALDALENLGNQVDGNGLEHWQKFLAQRDQE